MVILDRRKSRVPLRVWATGDWHAGHQNFDEPTFERHFQRAVRERWLLLHVGDSLELVTPTSRVARRGALREQSMEIAAQRQWLKRHLAQIEGGAILPGNHEWRIDMATGLRFIEDVTEHTPIVCLTEPGFVRIVVGKHSYVFFLHHGEGPAANPFTLHDRLQRDVEGVDAILCGHIHQLALRPVEVFGPNGPRIVQQFRTGHYLKRPIYAAIRPIGPVGGRGSWLLTLDPTEHRLTAEWLR